MKDRILSFISLAQKAGKIASGQFLCEKALKEGKAFAVIIAGDASDNTKNILKICAHTGTFPVLNIQTWTVWEEHAEKKKGLLWQSAIRVLQII